DENTAEIICDNPYPCDFDKGIIESMARMFKPQKSLQVSVTHDNSEECRKKGHSECCYTVNW
ncbi:hypothetical protein KJ632_02545, partial [Patescibacteria group bacterium]|nr:hypothetical protein [Patescibacteria group bacterium]